MFERPYSYNGYVAVAPFHRDLEVKVNERARMAGIRQKSEMAQSVVVYGNEKIPTGSLVFLKGDAHRNLDATVVYEIEPSVKFVLVPESYVQLVFPPGAYALKPEAR